MTTDTTYTDYTRIILPDGKGRTFPGQLPLRVGQQINREDLAQWPELNGWEVYSCSFDRNGCHNERNEWTPGASCLFVYLAGQRDEEATS